MRSNDIAELSKALTNAQKEIIGAVKDSQNPFFKSSYADLSSVWDAIREPMSKNGLSVSQSIGFVQSEDVFHDTLTTTLMHSSGQWIDSTMMLKPVKNDPQAQGSAITYARRYSLAAIIGCPQIDDDGNHASHHRHDHNQHHEEQSVAKAFPGAQPKVTEPQLKRLYAITKSKGWSPADVKSEMDKMSVKDSKDLNRQQYDALIHIIETTNPSGNLPL
jgi:ERF superfamily